MDCTTCGCELIGYKVEAMAAVCSENHLICTKCNQEYKEICPICESTALYCDILPFDYKSFTLYADMLRQSANTQQTVQTSMHQDSELLAAEDEVIEEEVLEDDEDNDNDNEVERVVQAKEKEPEEEEEDLAKMAQFPFVDSLTLAHKKLDKPEPMATETPTEEDYDSSAFDLSEVETSDSSDCDSEEQSLNNANLLKQIPENPVKLSKMQEKLKHASLYTQVKYLCVDPVKPYNLTKKEQAATHKEESEQSDVKKVRHKKKSPIIYLDEEGLPQELPSCSFTPDFDWDEEQQFNENVFSAEPDKSRKLFFWRCVKKDQTMFNSMFVKTLSKNDKRAIAIFERLEENCKSE